MTIAGIDYTVDMLFVKGIGKQEIASFASGEFIICILIAFVLLIKILIDEKAVFINADKRDSV